MYGIKKMQKDKKVVPVSRPRVWIFDMDDTLYNASAGMFDEIHARMRAFIADALGVGEPRAVEFQRAYWAKYGATFLGLERHHGIAPEKFLEKTHDFDPVPLVRTALPARHICASIRRLPGRKVLLTNGPKHYVQQILKSLHLQGVFNFVLTSSDMRIMSRWRCKPDNAILCRILSRLGAKPEDCVLIEDSLKNIKAAHSLHMKTVWCVGYSRGFRGSRPGYVDAVIDNVTELSHVCMRRK